jgi:predicted nucleic acid-binding protein
MRFWDSSALVPLLVTSQATPAVIEAFRADPEVIVWWASLVECTSALARLEREGHLDGSARVAAKGRLERYATGWQEVVPADRVRDTANRLLLVHPIRAADALQLAAAIVASEDDPRSLTIVTLDERLARAAEREGFPVLEPRPSG